MGDLTMFRDIQIIMLLVWIMPVVIGTIAGVISARYKVINANKMPLPNLNVIDRSLLD
jgi:hypothetical protein